MKTRQDWPQPRDPHAHEPVERFYFSVFDDVPVFVDGDETLAIPFESMAELVERRA